MGGLRPKIFGASLLGIGLVTWAFLGNEVSGESINAPSAVVVSKTPSPKQVVINADRDGNGIDDWKEKVSVANAGTTSEPASSYEPPDTITDSIGIELIEGLVASKLLGTYAPDSNQLVENTANTAVRSAFSFKTYTRADVDVSTDTSDETLLAYAVRVTEIIMQNTVPEGTRHEMEIVSQALTSQKTEDLTELSYIIDAYDAAIADMQTVSVPEELVEVHLSILNSYVVIERTLDSLLDSFEDPVRAAIGVRGYQVAIDNLGDSLQELYGGLSHKGIRVNTGNAESDAFIALFN